jgi:hypothetical protein
MNNRKPKFNVMEGNKIKNYKQKKQNGETENESNEQKKNW